MKNLAGRRGLHDLHIGVSRQLHKALKSCRTVFWALAFITVRQHQGDAVHTSPLHFPGGNELVDHDLCTVGKITELCFPDHQRARIVGRIAVLKRKHGFF